MQFSGREMQGMPSSLNGISTTARGALHELRNGQEQQGFENHVSGPGDISGHDDFFEQMLPGLPVSWSELGDESTAAQKLFSVGLAGKSLEEAGTHYGESSLLAACLQHHQIGVSGGSSPGTQMMRNHSQQQQQQQQLFLQGIGGSSAGASGELGLHTLLLRLGRGSGSRDEVDAPFTSLNSTSGERLYNGYGGSIECATQALKQQHFYSQSSGGAPQTSGVGQAMTGASASASAGGGTAPPRQRVRARRGQATDPHSIAERLRRERIAERMKGLQELVPNANKTDKATMLDEIIDYVKFLQLQVKVLSMSRLGGAAAVAPLVADMSSENGMERQGPNGGNESSLTVTEHQVAKLMDEDMGSAMQYLQGKGLCLMPISLASAISTTTCHVPRSTQTSSAAGHLIHRIVSGSHPVVQRNGAAAGGNGPTSPGASVLTVQSAMTNNGANIDISRRSGDKDNPTKA